MGSTHAHDRRDEIVNASISAPAKLTLSLRITGVRNDGYHLIDAIMTTLDLADELSIDPSVAPSRLDVDGPFAEGVPTSSDNLVLRALDLVGRTAAVARVRAVDDSDDAALARPIDQRLDGDHDDRLAGP